MITFQYQKHDVKTDNKSNGSNHHASKYIHRDQALKSSKLYDADSQFIIVYMVSQTHIPRRLPEPSEMAGQDTYDHSVVIPPIPWTQWESEELQTESVSNSLRVHKTLIKTQVHKASCGSIHSTSVTRTRVPKPDKSRLYAMCIVKTA